MPTYPLPWFAHQNDRAHFTEVEFLNSLGWNLTLVKAPLGYSVLTGDQPLIFGATEDEAHAFVFGMAVSVGYLPEETLSLIKSQ